MTSTMVQDRHVLQGQYEHTPTQSKTPSKLQRQEHPGLLLGVFDTANGQTESLVLGSSRNLVGIVADKPEEGASASR